eukprot:TRINITY_DN4064_c0_g1_i1.p4 TRINITY_DN4064_c0_g1~~TRINITY_DN4064_c0_g1_i1.p4  ORF type:complete len:103 (-),score=28.63 TRINITY_DN4064_c0_g1_i1:152-460(-)
MPLSTPTPQNSQTQFLPQIQLTPFYTPLLQQQKKSQLDLVQIDKNENKEEKFNEIIQNLQQDIQANNEKFGTSDKDKDLELDLNLIDETYYDIHKQLSLIHI